MNIAGSLESSHPQAATYGMFFQAPLPVCYTNIIISSFIDVFGPLNGHNNEHVDLFNGQDPFSYSSGLGSEAFEVKSSVGSPQATSSSQGSTADGQQTIRSQPWMSCESTIYYLLYISHILSTYVSLDVCEGFVTNADRLSEAGDASALLDFREVHDLPVPTLDATIAVLLQLFTENPGVKWGELMKVLGSCKLCGEVVALAAFSKHRCVCSFLDDINAAAARDSDSDAHSASSTPAVISPTSSPAYASSSTLATPPLKLEEECEGSLLRGPLICEEAQVKSERNEEGGVEVIDLTHDDE